jgi:predicted RNase H-like HicB family nuclease
VVDVKSYPVIIEQDETGFVVSCPVFKGCYSQGNTIDEALKNIKEAIELCIIDDEENPVSSIIVGNMVLER